MQTIPIVKLDPCLNRANFSGNVNIRTIEELLPGKDIRQEFHRHDFFYLLMIERGAGEHIIDFVSYKVQDYSVFFLRPGQVHKLELEVETTGYIIQFTSDFYFPQSHEAGKLLSKASRTNYYQADADKSKKILSILGYMLEEFREKQQDYQEVIKANLGIFFIELLRQGKNTENLTTNSQLYQQERLEEFLKLLETHITTKKQVSEFAEMLHLSSYQLNAITKALLGKTCSTVIDEYIILESKRFLLGTPSQVKDIAFHLGYDDISYFVRFFRKQTGYSPEAFRQNFK